MRKSISISFAVLYTVLTVGIQVHMHFCHDELKDLSLFEQNDTCCETEKTDSCELESKCCEFAEVEFSLEDEHQAVSKYSVDQFVFNESQAHLASFTEEIFSGFSIVKEQLRGPPERLYLLNCTFTFYG